ncbi:Holo-[acyl-carrier-protein] synthase [Psilocybe cubensis]|uniref:Holo-[acyl-carrier-protein] synthase n=1 Tax=Psilocybe cubensis TaxID=181762 RepID=A0ACB8H5I7_PSICU|nr:Holo-[acyl-carrier-protein] synthase [Psilocybe cubensis]KAH9482450.1 Holo-[acyl-carrier-protein] synthase [Psilocybe cubensis]
MTILGIGVDLVHVPRITSILTRNHGDRFAARILSNEELSEWQSLGLVSISHRARFLAVRWSVKESTYKAMYPITRPSWKEVSYHGLSAQRQKPFVSYHPFRSENKEKIGSIHVSVSHDGDYVYSSVCIEAPMNLCRHTSP